MEAKRKRDGQGGGEEEGLLSPIPLFNIYVRRLRTCGTARRSEI